MVEFTKNELDELKKNHDLILKLFERRKASVINRLETSVDNERDAFIGHLKLRILHEMRSDIEYEIIKE